MPKVDSLTKTDTTIVFTGKNFYTTDHVGKANFIGIQADSVVVNSATQVTATWTTGVPTTSSTSEYPVLYFVKTLVTTPCVVTAGEACTGDDKVKVESQTKTEKTVVFTGKNFLTSGYTAKVILKAKEATVVVDSATKVTATWKDGVPTVASASEKAVLSFTKDGIIDTFYAISS